MRNTSEAVLRLQYMYKRLKTDDYIVHEEIRTRLHDAPVLHVPFPNNEQFKKSIMYRGSNAWNSLPPDERNITTFESFKSMLKMKLKDNII